MYTLSRIITGFFLLIVFLGVVLSVFFQNNQGESTDMNFLFEEKDLAYSGSFLYQAFSKNEEIFLAEQEENTYNFSGSGNTKILELGKNKFLTSLRDIGYEYQIIGKNYIIHQSGPGEVYVDTITDPNKVFILSISAPVRLSLVSDDGTESFTEIFLTPHMYAEFQPLRGKFLKDADRLRVETIFHLGYIAEKITDEIGDDIVFQKYSGGESTFLQETYEFLAQKKHRAENNISEIISREIYILPGFALIQRYGNLFINPEKQKIFYKNIILSQMVQILSGDDFQQIPRVKGDLAKLKLLDIAAYERSVQNIENILSYVLLSTKPDDISKKAKIYSLLSPNISKSENKKFYDYSYSVFSRFNNGEYISNEIIKKNNDVFREFLLGYTYPVVAQEYYIYFLEKLLLGELEKQGEKDFEKMVQILSFFNEFAQDIYTTDIERKITGIYIYNELLEKFEGALRNELFHEQKDSSNLLSPNESNIIGIDTIRDLRKEISASNTFYEMYSNALNLSNARDKNIADTFEEREKRFSEYLLALENYEQYISTYDEINKDILVSDYRDESHDFNKGYILSYLSQFVGINLSRIEIELSESYYRVKNMYISGKKFRFDIFPEENHRLTNIFIDDIQKNFEYKLDSRQIEWDEKYRTASQEKKDNYDFSRFFLITFFDDTSGGTSQVFYDKKNTLEEDKTAIVFKRDILLGNRGDFSDISDFTNIEYEDILLQKGDESYDIYISQAEYNISIQEDNQSREYLGDFKTSYIRSENINDGYFSGLSINVYTSQGGNKQFLFGGGDILFSGKIRRVDFENTLRDFLYMLSQYTNMYGEILSLPNVSNIIVQYSPAGEKMTYKFEKNGNNHTILYSELGIEQILIGVSKQLSSPITAQELSRYIQ